MVVARKGQIEIVHRRSGPTGVTVDINPHLAMRVRPDGTVLKMNFDGTTEIVDVDAKGLAPQTTEQWLEQACAIAGRDLTQEEWDTHVSADNPRQPRCAE